MRRPASQQWIIRGSIASVVLSLVIAACVTSEHPRPTCAVLADGGPARIDPPDATTFISVPSTDAQATTALGIEEDPGPTCTNCQAGDAYEIMTVVDFEEGYGPAWIDYGEPGAAVEPHSVGAACDASVNVPAPYYGLQAVDLSTQPGGARCASRYALHMEGGPFKTWGGGYATQFLSVRGQKWVDQYCPPDLPAGPATTGIGIAPVASGESCSFWATPVSGQPSRTGIDVSQFEGLSLWARRGPGGASTLRIALLDGNTAPESALSAEQQGLPPPCKRVVSCCQSCLLDHHAYLDASVDPTTNQETLSAVEEDDYRCIVDGEAPSPIQLHPGSELDASDFLYRNGCTNELKASADEHNTQNIKSAWDSWNRDHKPCCPKTVAEDPKYGGDFKDECAPYVFKYDYSSGNYCQLPGEKLPEKNDNRCDDGFEAPIVVDTEWKLFRIPWSELRRSTLGRPPLDPHGIWTIRIYPGAGWLDTYIDDIGFYRKRQ